MTPPETKIKVTVYYWPHANNGLGHVACELIQTQPKETSLGYITANANSSSVAYLQDEIKTYNSPNVIKIQLPPTTITPNALGNILDNISDNLDKKYNLLTRNCAHLTSKVLSLVYGDQISHRSPQWIMTPKMIAGHTCLFLDRGKSLRENIECLKALSSTSPIDNQTITSEAVRGISHHEFAKVMIGTLTQQMKGLTKDNNELTTCFNNFNNAINREPINDQEATKSLTALHKQMAQAEEKLQGSITSPLQRLKAHFYEFVRIFAQDPQLEHLRDFRKAAEQINKLGFDTKQHEEPSSQVTPT
ncbi:MAG: hypothetical protein ACD_21C00189G0002 [uncultured bacterium]|nr:MAG: hypothetical protein ACD_21C00189G0002 [uncultured bacterium]